MSGSSGPLQQAVAYRPIGLLRSPHVEVAPELRAGLMDLEGFSHVILLYHLRRISGFDLVVRPFLDTCKADGRFR
jgi:tRNA (Thr-GGU) A37 N-methylase